MSNSDDEQGRQVIRPAPRVPVWKKKLINWVAWGATGLAVQPVGFIAADIIDAHVNLSMPDRWSSSNGSRPRIVGIGDSMNGASDFEVNPRNPASGQSLYDLPHVVGEALDMEPVDLYQQGARTSAMLRDQVQRVPRDAEVILISTGSNDSYSRDVEGQEDSYIEITTALGNCVKAYLLGADPCGPELAGDWDRGLVQLRRELPSAIRAVRLRAPNATIILMSPVQPLVTLGPDAALAPNVGPDGRVHVEDGCMGMWGADTELVASYMERLSGVLRDVADETGVAFFDQDTVAAWDGNRACDGGDQDMVVEFNLYNFIMHGRRIPPLAGLLGVTAKYKVFHPSAEGWARTAPALVDFIQSGAAVKQQTYDLVG